MDRSRANALAELEQDGDFRIAKEDVDPRGWAVVGCNAAELGKVRTLLVDTDLMRAMYFVCDLTPNRAVLLPVVYARLDKSNCRVIFDVVDAAMCDRLPAYTGEMPDEARRDRIVWIIASGIANAAPAATERRQLDRRSA